MVDWKDKLTREKKGPLSLSPFIREHLLKKGVSGDFIYAIFDSYRKYSELHNKRGAKYKTVMEYISRLRRLKLITHIRFEDSPKGFKRSYYRINPQRKDNADWFRLPDAAKRIAKKSL